VLVACLATAVVLAACGGGDDSSDGTTTTAGDRATTTADVAPATTVASDGSPAGDPVPSEGCATPSTAAPMTEEHHDVDVDGTGRWFLLTTPAPTGRPMPLLLDFHGLSEGAEIHTRMSGFDELAQAEGFAVAYPNGTGSPVRWQIGADDDADLRFVDTMLDGLGRELCLDLSRIYATGLSNGAMFTSVLACQRPDRIAAIAPVSGILYPEGCQTERPVPIMTFHGTADPILYFNGGVGALGSLMEGTTDATSVSVPPADVEGAGYPANVRSWADHNGCEPKPDDTRPVPDVLLRTYDCPEDGPVDFYVVEGGGHSWPGSAFSEAIINIVGPTNMGLHASELIWDFLSGFRLPAD
jgi:polyhydroxybutyrate depolymerase